MDRKYQSIFCHGSEDWIELSDIGHAGRGIGRGIGRIELGCQDALACGGDDDIRSRRVIGEVDGHERIEMPALWGGIERLTNPSPIVERVAGLSDRRFEIGHDERSTEDLGGVPEYRPHFFSIPKVQMPVIWPTERNGSLGHGNTSCFRLSLREDFVCCSNDPSHAPGSDGAERSDEDGIAAGPIESLEILDGSDAIATNDRYGDAAVSEVAHFFERERQTLRTRKSSIRRQATFVDR